VAPVRRNAGKKNRGAGTGDAGVSGTACRAELKALSVPAAIIHELSAPVASSRRLAPKRLRREQSSRHGEP
jgi:hypothetical protein